MRENLVKVRVVEFGDRQHYQMQYVDPNTRRKVTRTTGIERTGRKRERGEAEKVAGAWQQELREGRYQPPGRTTWADFRERYEREVLDSLAEGTARKVWGVFNAVEAKLNPQKLVDLTEQRLSHWQAGMRAAGLSESTIKSNLAHLKAALRWAASMGLLAKAPRIVMPKRAKGGKGNDPMKGRPISGEEFDRLLAKVPAVVGEQAAPSWIHYLRGLWLSGLRLSESLDLFWDRDDKLCIDLTGDHPTMRIPAELEKGNQDRQLPLAPEFAEFLLATPETKRTGRVFNLAARRTHGERLGHYQVSRLVCRIGKAAGIKVATDARTGRVKFASAHDLRRSFGERWASRIMPADLKALMRHESIDTTMRFYVGRNAQNTAKTLWDAHRKAAGNTFGNTGVFDGSGTAADNALTPSDTR